MTTLDQYVELIKREAPKPDLPYGFKLGDRVILVDSPHKWIDQDNNPIWNGAYGQVVGTIDASYGNGPGLCRIGVRWDNKTHNSYYGDELRFCPLTVPTSAVTAEDPAFTSMAEDFYRRMGS